MHADRLLSWVGLLLALVDVTAFVLA